MKLNLHKSISAALALCMLLSSVPAVATELPEEAAAVQEVQVETQEAVVSEAAEAEIDVQPEASEAQVTAEMLEAAPELSSVSNVYGGVKLAWKSVDQAAAYRVYRKSGSGSWQELGETENKSYTDKTAKSGTTYTYTACALYSDGSCSRYESGLKIKYYAAPELTNAENTASGIKVSWEKVTGADQYQLYRKTEGGSWARLKRLTDTSYTDTSAKSGTSYIYTVRAMNSGEITSSYDSKGLSIRRLTVPELQAATNVKNGVKVTWESVTGAEEYIVYRKTKDTNWSSLKTVTGTSYTDTTAKSGTTYTYTVRARYNGKRSYFDKNGVSTLALSITQVTAKKSDGSVKVKWDSVSGAKGYYVYRKPKDGKWARIAKTSSTSYTDQEFTKNGTYLYTVRAYNGSTAGYYDNAAAPSVSVKISTSTATKRLKSVMEIYPDGKCLGSSYRFAGAGQCMGFAREVYYKMYGEVAKWDYAGDPKESSDEGKFTKVAKTSSLSASSVRSVISKAKPGDILQLNEPKMHSMVFVSSDENGYTVYDNNWVGANVVDVRYISYGSFSSRNSSGMSLLHANNYPIE